MPKRMSSGGAHGWNIDDGRRLRGWGVSTLFRQLEGFSFWRVVACTLLGPEGPGFLPCVGGGWFFLGLLFRGGCCGVGGFRLLVENYTVDASILDSTLLGLGHNWSALGLSWGGP